MSERRAASLILGALAASFLALALAPLVLDDSYRWVEHTTSEAAGQAVEGAWLTRSGFVLFGLAYLWYGREALVAVPRPGP